MKTLNYIATKFNLFKRKLPIEIPNAGRDSIAIVLNELGFKKGVEIGTEQGLYAEVLCKAIPGLDLTCVDAWLAYEGYRETITQEHVDRLYYNACVRLAPYNVKIIKGLSMDIVHTFPDESLDFVYIDANHTYEHVTQDVTEWAKKVRPGGIVFGHDYIKKTIREGKPSQNNGVVPALHDYTKKMGINPWFVVGAKNAKKGHIRDKSRSWLFIKE